MPNYLAAIKERLSIQEGTENEFAKRSVISAGATALALTEVFLGMDFGVKEVFFPLAGASGFTSIYHGDRARSIVFHAAKTAVLDLFDEQTR